MSVEQLNALFYGSPPTGKSRAYKPTRPSHLRVLAALETCSAPHGERCAYFKTIAREAEMEDLREVRRITRHLARKGLAEYWRGLSTEDGDFAGSGYCITPAGCAILEQYENGEEW